MFNKKKLLIAILLSLLIIIIVLVVVFVCREKEPKSSGEETAEWKTYRNEEFGFEIDYPTEGWEIEEKYLGGPLLLALDILNKKEKNRFLSFYIESRIWVIPFPCENLTWEEIMGKFYHCTGGGGIYTIDFQQEIASESRIKGYRGKATDARGEMEGALFPIPGGLEWKGEKIEHACIIFTYYLEPEPTPEEIEIFNRVVSSFRFIEE